MQKGHLHDHKIIEAALLLLVGLAIAGCGTDNTQSSPTPPTQDEEQRQAAAPESDAIEEPTLSEFLAYGLHPIDPAPPGRFRLEVAGEVHEGDLGGCGWTMRTADGQNQDRFAATADWRADDGRSLQLEIWRFVMHDDYFWNASHGHESDRVDLRLRDDGGSLASVRDTASSLLRAIRPRPGANVRWRAGSGESPVVRVAPDGRQATAAGELEGRASENGTSLTGPFTLAVHCAPI